MNIVWFSWKDENHPQAGGAELVSTHIRRNLVRDGHNVILITAHYPNSKKEDEIEGVKIHRLGSRYSVYIKAFLFFRKNFKIWPDIVIDEMNTLPFWCAFYTKKRTILFTYQLARRVWFYQIVFPFSLIGYLLEPIYLFLLSLKYREVITESESTRQDLKKYGFKPNNVDVVRVGIALEPVKELKPKAHINQILFLGALRPMKRTLDAVKAFEYAKDKNPGIAMHIAGDDSGSYAYKVKNYVSKSRHKSSINIFGRVTNKQRLKLMKEAAVIVVTSIKEGWGLIVTEANGQGTPAVAYDTDGLRDSVKHHKTGLLVKSGDTAKLGQAINEILSDKKTYENYRKNAWQWSQDFTFANSYDDFKKVLFK